MTLIDYPVLSGCLTELGLDDHHETLVDLVERRLSEKSHGDFGKWRDVLSKLATEPENDDVRRDLLLQLSPWRKGPFVVGDVHIDAEWRSNLKWDRVKDALEPLEHRNVLDVGCGNGYYAMRMREAGAATVIGIDPTLLYVMQFIALRSLLNIDRVHVLPLRLNEWPENSPSFDTTFSMGVLYHQRSPLDHLRQLKGTLRPGGQLVLETLYVPGEESYACTPADRYARMRNVWLLPTIAELTTWLQRSGYEQIKIVDKSRTTTDEQRSTEWMPFDSLREALMPDDPDRTVEGWPAPRRVVAVAKTP